MLHLKYAETLLGEIARIARIDLDYMAWSKVVSPILKVECRWRHQLSGPVSRNTAILSLRYPMSRDTL